MVVMRGCLWSLGVMWCLQASASDRLDLSGFLTISATQTDNSQKTAYQSGVATADIRFSGTDNHFGVQLKSDVNSKLSITSQFITHAHQDSHALRLDWAYAKYNMASFMDVHLGKFKVPQSLIYDVEEVGYAYPWVRPPQDVYSINQLSSLSGIDFRFKVPVGGGRWILQMYYGSDEHHHAFPARQIELGGLALTPGQGVAMKNYDMGGASFSTRSNAFTFQLSHFISKVDIDDLGIKADRVKYSSAGFIYDSHGMLVYAEAVSRDNLVDQPSVLPDQNAWYVTLGYRFGGLLPMLTYASIDEGADPQAAAVRETSQSLGIRYELGPSAAFKAEVLRVQPQAGNHGLFERPVQQGMVYTFTMDMLFH